MSQDTKNLRSNEIDTFYDHIETIKNKQHPNVDGAVKGIINEIHRENEDIVCEIHLPMYSETFTEKIAKVDGKIYDNSILSEYIDDFDDISLLSGQNPIPIKKEDGKYKHNQKTSSNTSNWSYRSIKNKYSKHRTVFLISLVPVVTTIMFLGLGLIHPAFVYVYFAILFIYLLSIILDGLDRL